MGGQDCTNAKDPSYPLPVSSVFVYDPVGNSWSTGLPMPVALAVGDNFSAIALNGKIFLFDGLSVWAYSPPVYMFTKN